MTGVRMATVEDASAVLEIYTPYVQHSSISFEEEAPSLQEMERRIADCLKQYPFLVCEIAGKTAGYAYASRYRTRSAYRYDTESSIYLSPEFQGRQIGSALYQALFELLRAQGIFTVYAAITVPNEQSVGFHHRFGFRTLGVHPASGYKQGAWRDVLWMEKTLLAREGIPGQVVPTQQLPPALLESILHRAGARLSAPAK